MLRPRNLSTSSRPLTASQSRAVAAYLGLAIGDALGATVEFMTPGEIRRQYGTHRDIIGGGWLRLKPGHTTDDTAMSLALGEAILRVGHVDALAAAQAFDQWMRSKPIDIGNTVRRNLIAFRRTGIPEATPCEHDAGNGALMRVLPVALACHGAPWETVCQASRAQAHVTHHNALSDAACEAILGLLGGFMAGDKIGPLAKRYLEPLYTGFPVFKLPAQARENPSGYVVETLQAVVQSLLKTDSFEACLVDVVNRGGDADTTGAIAGMLAGAYYGLANIPGRWLKALRTETRERCQQQALALMMLTSATAPGP